MRKGRIVHRPLKNSLVNLPIAIYGPLLQRDTRPQHLAVHLRAHPSANAHVGAAIEAYVGWTGMASASSLAHFNVPGAERGMDTVEIDPQFAADLGFPEGTVVELGLLHDLPTAAAVGAEPATPDDWEIIELHAAHLESHLLSQVRVAAVGQEIDVWVLGQTRVRLRVASINGSTESKSASLLSTDTEVSIAPKTRASKSNKPSAQPNGKVSTAPSSSTAASDASSGALAPPPTAKLPIALRVLPPAFLPPHLTHPQNDDEPVVAYVSPDTFALMSPALPSRSKSDPNAPAPSPPPSRCYRTRIMRLPSPLPPPPAGAASPASQTASTSSMISTVSPTPKLLKPTSGPSSSSTAAADGDDVSSKKASTDGVVEVLVYCVTVPEVDAEAEEGESAAEESRSVWLPIPDDHIVFASAYGEASVGVHACDLILVSVTREEDIPIFTSTTEPTANSQTPGNQPSTPTQQLAGMKDTISSALNFVSTAVVASEITGPGSLGRAPGMLITGNQGMGKTTLLKTLASMLQTQSSTGTHPVHRQFYPYTHYVDVAEYSTQTPTAIRALFEYWLDICLWHHPSVLLLDNLDSLLSAEVEHTDSFRSRHLTELFLSTFLPPGSSAAPVPGASRAPPPGKRTMHGVTLIASAGSLQALHPLMGTKHVFAEVVKMKAPGRDARRDILARVVQDRIAASATALRTDPDAPLNYMSVATETEGYSASDLQDLVSRAVHQALVRVTASTDDELDEGPISLIMEDFEAARKDYVPLNLRSVKLQTSDVSWADIGGLRETKKILRETLEWPTKYGPIFAKAPLRLRSGLLLYGYPGCGKTLLASAVAKECGLNFISVKGPELLNKYIGASEKSVRDLFERASAAKPCVLFFDEFDSIAPKRGHDSTGVTDRVVNQMLTQMDGAEGLDGVYVLAATSRPDLIDGALLRPGRLDKSLLCNLPDTSDRLEILEAVSKKVKLAPSVDLSVYAEQTEGFSGADLQALVYNAQLEVIHAAIAAGGGRKKGQEPRSGSASTKEERVITDEYLRKSLGITRPSVPADERERLGRIYRGFVSERGGALPVPPDGGTVGNRVSLM